MAADRAHTATLRVHCADRPGLVAALAQLLYGHGANILDADQHADARAGKFFQRIRFDTRALHTDRVSLERGIGEVAERFGMRWHLRYAGETPRMAIFVSKYRHCIYDLLQRHEAGELRCEIPFVAGNHPDCAPIAEHFGVPYHHIPVPRGGKAAAEARQLELLAEHRVDLVVLARYMQILTADFLEGFSGDVINIHHSFLPSFIGSKPYHRAHARGVKLIGATAHYVTAELDEGPIIEQDVVRVGHRDAVRDLVRKGRDVERQVLARAVGWHLDDRVIRYANKTVVFA